MVALQLYLMDKVYVGGNHFIGKYFKFFNMM